MSPMSSVAPTVTTSGGIDISFTKMTGGYAAARRRAHNASSIERKIAITSPSSICESYKNVDFFAVQEPYTVVKNKFANKGRSP